MNDATRGGLTITPRTTARNLLPPAIGLSGYGRSGKTTAADYLSSKYGYTRLHIAEPLRDMLRTLLRWFGYDHGTIDRYLTGDLKELEVPVLGVTSRRAQITLGTEWGRELIAPDLWSRLWEHTAETAHYDDPDARSMNDSVRFPNEETAIRALGGVTILIRRRGTQPIAWRWGRVGRLLYRLGCHIGVHDSERVDRLRPDYVIDNDGSIEDLHRKIDDLIGRVVTLKVNS